MNRRTETWKQEQQAWNRPRARSGLTGAGRGQAGGRVCHSATHISSPRLPAMSAVAATHRSVTALSNPTKAGRPPPALLGFVLHLPEGLGGHTSSPPGLCDHTHRRAEEPPLPGQPSVRVRCSRCPSFGGTVLQGSPPSLCSSGVTTMASACLLLPPPSCPLPEINSQTSYLQLKCCLRLGVHENSN